MDIAIPFFAALAGAAAIPVARRFAAAAWLRAAKRPAVLIHTKDGQSIRGVLVRRQPDALVLEQPDYLTGVKPQGLGGTVVIPRSNVAWWQEIPVTDLTVAENGAPDRLAAVS